MRHAYAAVASLADRYAAAGRYNGADQRHRRAGFLIRDPDRHQRLSRTASGVFLRIMATPSAEGVKPASVRADGARAMSSVSEEVRERVGGHDRKGCRCGRAWDPLVDEAGLRCSAAGVEPAAAGIDPRIRWSPEADAVAASETYTSADLERCRRAAIGRYAHLPRGRRDRRRRHDPAPSHEADRGRPDEVGAPSVGDTGNLAISKGIIGNPWWGYQPRATPK